MEISKFKVFDNVYYVATAIFLLIISNPYYIWGWFQLSYAIALFSVLFFSIFARNTITIEKALLSFVVFVLVYYYCKKNGASFWGGLGFSVGGAYICSLKDEVLFEIYLMFKRIYSLMLLPGLMLWFVHIIFNSSIFYVGAIPSEVIPNQMKVEAGQGYALYPFTVVLDYMLDQPIYRFMGPFDEPGRVGTISALLLAVGNFKLKNKYDYLILLSGFASLSLAFIAISFLYMAVMSFSNLKYFLTVVACVILTLYAANFSEAVRGLTVDRMHVSEGNLSGDNRSNDSLERNFDQWINGTHLELLNGTSNYVADGASSWKEVCVRTGLIGLVTLFLIFSMSFVSRGVGGYDLVRLQAFLIVFIASFYQRPEIASPDYIMIFLVGLLGAKKSIKNISKVI